MTAVQTAATKLAAIRESIEDTRNRIRKEENALEELERELLTATTDHQRAVAAADAGSLPIGTRVRYRSLTLEGTIAENDGTGLAVKWDGTEAPAASGYAASELVTL
jgi:hypothetical protein